MTNMKGWIEKSLDGDERNYVQNIQAGLNAYGKQLINLVNNAPAGDLPLVLIVMDQILSALRSAEPESEEMADLIRKLDIHTVMIKGKGHDDDSTD